jgi:hypothetical protein
VKDLWKLGAALAFLPLCFSCGLEVYYSLEPPSMRVFIEGPEDPVNNYFSFYTNETGNKTIAFKGTNVFYRIYNNLSELTSDITSVSAVNTAYTTNGYSRISSLGYRQLDSTGRHSVLLENTGSNREVRIRLSTQQSYTPSFSPLGETPIRMTNRQGFDFYKDDDPNLCDDLPVSGDLDTRYSTFTTADTWYVNAYAVSVGQDEYLNPLYSQLLHLGYVRIHRE